jgi:hypothetical protein
MDGLARDVKGAESAFDSHSQRHSVEESLGCAALRQHLGVIPQRSRLTPERAIEDYAGCEYASRSAGRFHLSVPRLRRR